MKRVSKRGWVELGRGERSSWAIGISLAMLLSACGGSAVDTSPGNAGGPNGGGSPGIAGTSSAVAGNAPAVPGDAPTVPGGEPEVPLLNGIPIGDCREPTADEHAALGCPQSPPTEGAPCDFARGASCAYSLSTDRGDASQNLYFCSNDAERQWSLTQEQCGYVCTDRGPKVLEFDVADCATREEDNCQDAGVVYAYTPSGSRRMSDLLSQAIRHCAPADLNLSVSLDLVRGCVKSFSTTHEFSQAALACLRERFESLRYACAEKVPCVSYNAFFADGP